MPRPSTITLFISRKGAEQAASMALMRLGCDGFHIAPATLRDEDSGHIERGFRVTLLGHNAQPVAFL